MADTLVDILTKRAYETEGEYAGPWEQIDKELRAEIKYRIRIILRELGDLVAETPELRGWSEGDATLFCDLVNHVLKDKP